MARWIRSPLGDTAPTDPKDNERTEPSPSYREGKRDGQAHRGRGDKRTVSLPNQATYRGGPPHYESFPRAPHQAKMISKGQRTKNP